MKMHKGSYVAELRGIRKTLYVIFPKYRKWLNSIGVYYGENNE